MDSKLGNLQVTIDEVDKMASKLENNTEPRKNGVFPDELKPQRLPQRENALLKQTGKGCSFQAYPQASFESSCMQAPVYDFKKRPRGSRGRRRKKNKDQQNKAGFHEEEEQFAKMGELILA